MRHIYIFFFLFACTGPAHAQFETRDATKPVKVTKTFDGTFDFRDLDCKTEVSTLVGEELFFAKSNASDEEHAQFANLLAENSVLLDSLLTPEQLKILNDPTTGGGWAIADFSWKPRIVDGRANWSTQYVDNEDYRTHIYKPIVVWVGGVMRRMEIKTPYSAVENKTFKIIDCADSVIDRYYNICFITFTLQDDSGNIFRWGYNTNTARDYNVYLKRHLSARKKECVGQKFYVRRDCIVPEKCYNILTSKVYKNEPEKEYTCTELTFVKSALSGHSLPCLVLKDSAGMEIAVGPDPEHTEPEVNGSIAYYWNEEEYNNYKEHEKRTQDSLTNARQKAEAQLEKEETAYLKGLVKKYGRTMGMTIAIGEVKLGMTEAMCRDSWGDPAVTTKSESKGTITDIWRYGIFRGLKFTNGFLTAYTE